MNEINCNRSVSHLPLINSFSSSGRFIGKKIRALVGSSFPSFEKICSEKFFKKIQQPAENKPIKEVMFTSYEEPIFTQMVKEQITVLNEFYEKKLTNQALALNRNQFKFLSSLYNNTRVLDIIRELFLIDPKFYKTYMFQIEELKSFIYLTIDMPDLLALGSQRDVLLERSKKNILIENREKLDQKKAEMIDNLCDHSEIFDSLKIAFTQFTDDQASLNKEEPNFMHLQALILERDKWLDLTQEMFKDYHSGDIIFYKDDKERFQKGSKQSYLKFSLQSLLTGSQMGHVSVLVKRENQLFESHVTNTYHHDRMEISSMYNAVILRRSAQGSLSKLGQKVYEFLGITKEALNGFKDLSIEDVHREIELLYLNVAKEKQLVNNESIRRKALFGEWNTTARGLKLKELPKKYLYCSQFAKYTTDIADYKFNWFLRLQFLEKCKKEIESGKILSSEILKLKMFAEDFDSEFNFVTPLYKGWRSTIHPGALFRQMMDLKNKCEIISPSAKFKALFQQNFSAEQLQSKL